MTLTLIPDAEKLISDYLRDQGAVAAIVGRRVLGHSPASKDEPWVLVTQLSAPQDANSSADHLVAFFLQFDCYAGRDGGQPEANLLGRTVRAALVVADKSIEEVSAARINGDARILDTELEPARDRRALTATVYAHA